MSCTVSEIQMIKEVANNIRKRVLEHTLKNNGGYLSQACSSAEILATLYLKVMHLSSIKTPLKPTSFTGVPSNFNQSYLSGNYFNGIIHSDLDRFFLSPAQYALVLYATLIEAKRLSEDALDEFNKDGSIVEMIGAEHSPGMECMTGSLGQGLSQAAGVAWARKRKKDQGRVWVFMSDGEFQSGQTWEAIQTMAYLQQDNMAVYVDVNRQQCDGLVTSVMNIEPLHEKIKAFGAKAVRVDGHNIADLCKQGTIFYPGKPLFLLCDTNPTLGISPLNNNYPKLHYLRFNSEAEKKPYQELLNNWEI